MKITSYASSSAGNLYSVECNGSKILIECGLPIAKIKKHLKFKLHEFDACLLTHEHKDHAFSAHKIMGTGIDLYCSSGTAKSLNSKSY